MRATPSGSVGYSGGLPGASPPATLRCPCRAQHLAPRRWSMRTLSAFGIPTYFNAHARRTYLPTTPFGRSRWCRGRCACLLARLLVRPREKTLPSVSHGDGIRAVMEPLPPSRTLACLLLTASCQLLLTEGSQFKLHSRRVRRNRQRLLSSLLIENASAQHPDSSRHFSAQAFPIKASDYTSLYTTDQPFWV